jgi:hypothetical protein
MINLKHQSTHVMIATALGALLCASFAPAQAGLLGGGGSVARPLGANGQLGIQLSGSSSAAAPSPDVPLRQVTSGVQRGQAAAGDAAAQAKAKAESTGQAAAARSAEAVSSTAAQLDKSGHAGVDATASTPTPSAGVSAGAGASARGSAGTRH